MLLVYFGAGRRLSAASIFQRVSPSRPLFDNPVKAPTNLNYEPIKADGLAKAIGEPLSDFEEDFWLADTHVSHRI